jgi:uncharacterized protein YjbI with pentapeptide repeats
MFTPFEKLNPRWRERLYQARAEWDRREDRAAIVAWHLDPAPDSLYEKELDGMVLEAQDPDQPWRVSNKIIDANVQRYGQFRDGVFENCVFRMSTLDFVVFERVTFRHCFIRSCLIENAQFINTVFDGCVFEGSTQFHNCRFEGGMPGNRFVGCAQLDVFLDCHFDRFTDTAQDNTVKDPYSFYHQLKMAYIAGGALAQARHYAFLEECEFTRCQSSGRTRWIRLLDEWVTGYALRPSRVLRTAGLVIAVFALAFWFLLPEHGPSGALMVSSGAFYTFGFVLPLEEPVSLTLFRLFYTAEAFLGVLVNGLLLTTLQHTLFLGRGSF